MGEERLFCTECNTEPDLLVLLFWKELLIPCIFTGLQQALGMILNKYFHIYSPYWRACHFYFLKHRYQIYADVKAASQMLPSSLTV